MAYTPTTFGGYGPYYGGYAPQMPVQMPQNGPQMPQNAFQPQGNVNGQGGFACRPVTSKEEAMAVQVDFLGPGTIMPDLAHGLMYLKRFNSNTGSCDIFEFVAQTPKKEDPPVQYATLDDLNALRDELFKPRKTVKKNDADE